MSAKPTVLAFPKPRVFTSSETFIDSLRAELFASGSSWESIANNAGLSKSTIQRLASGQTKWPRQTTLFPILQALGLGVELRRAGK